MDLNTYLTENATMVDAFLHRYFGGATGDLARASAHLLLAGGKRLRPAVTRLAAEAVRRGYGSEVMPAAVALELTHTFTLIHDDIMDADSLRRGVPTVHTLWDMPTAILAGDVLFASSFEHIALVNAPAEARMQAVRLLAKTLVEICEGQHVDMVFEKGEAVTEDEYLTMVRKKTGVLYAAAASIGAVLAGGTEEQAEALYQYGLSTGMAFQIQDDLIDILADPRTSGKDRGSDIREGKQTILTIRAQKKGIDLSQYRGAVPDDRMDDLIRSLHSLGVIEEVRQVAAGLVREGNSRLQVIPPSPERELLAEIGLYFITRSA